MNCGVKGAATGLLMECVSVADLCGWGLPRPAPAGLPVGTDCDDCGPWETSAAKVSWWVLLLGRQIRGQPQCSVACPKARRSSGTCMQLCTFHGGMRGHATT